MMSNEALDSVYSMIYLDAEIHPRLTHPVKTFPGGPRWKIYPKKPSPVVPGEFSPVFLDPGENPFWDNRESLSPVNSG